MDKLINNKATSLILFAINAFVFLITFITSVHSNMVNAILYVVTAGIMLFILLPTIVLHYFEKLKAIRLHKFMSFVDYFAIFGMMVASLVLLFCSRFATVGCIMIIFEMIVSLFTAFVSLAQYKSIKTQREIQMEKRKAVADSSNAAERLKTLKNLFDQGIISKEEYEEKKKKYIELL